jgi:hypothetical protein
LIIFDLIGFSGSFDMSDFDGFRYSLLKKWQKYGRRDLPAVHTRYAAADGECIE